MAAEIKLRLYFAYGSNMDEKQMAQQCPNAKVVGRAEIKDYKVIINSRDVATIIPTSKKTVIGLLWTICPSDENELDRYDGVSAGYYHKAGFDIITQSCGTFSALIYLAADIIPGTPRPGYLEKIIAAAKRHGLEEKYVAELNSWREHGLREKTGISQV